MQPLRWWPWNPDRFEADFIRDEKGKVFRALAPWTIDISTVSLFAVNTGRNGQGS
jgi:hypothetical protein